MSSESWSRSTSSRSRYDDRKRRDRHYDDYDRDYDDRRRRRHSPERDRRRGSSERDRYRSYDDDRDSRHRRGKSPSRRHRQSRSRSRSSSYESSSKRRKSHREPFRSTEKKSSSSHSAELTNIKILRASRSRSKSQNKTTDDHSDRKTNYFESFHTGNVDNNSLIGNIDESDFDRERIHREMQERLQLHLAREGKVYPPPKPQASHPIFANDGSFLETFKKLQEQQKQHVHEHHKVEPSAAAIPAVQQQYQKPMFSKRRGGKILKTGIVQKTKIADESVTEETPNDAWSLYLQEVKKYKNVSCDADSKTRPLVK